MSGVHIDTEYCAALVVSISSSAMRLSLISSGPPGPPWRRSVMATAFVTLPEYVACIHIHAYVMWHIAHSVARWRRSVASGPPPGVALLRAGGEWAACTAPQHDTCFEAKEHERSAYRHRCLRIDHAGGCTFVLCIKVVDGSGSAHWLDERECRRRALGQLGTLNEIRDGRTSKISL
jgi:hypothetical protein